MASGYRDNKTGEVVITAYYADSETMQEQGLAETMKEGMMLLSVKEIVFLEPFSAKLQARIFATKTA